jgi:amino acid permease
MFAKITYGAAGTLFVKLVIIINNFGMCCAYLRIFGETAKNLAAVFFEKDSVWVSNWHNYIYVLFIFLVMAITIFKENLDSLRKASFLGVGGITVFFISLIVIFFYKLFSGLIEPFDSSMLWPQGDALDMIGSLPTVFLAYTFQFNMFPVYFTLKKKTKEEMKKTTNLAIIFCFFVYTISGFIGYYMYRNKLKDTILNTLIIDVESKDKFLLTALVVVNIAFLMSSTMSIPLMFFSLKNNFINSIIFCKKKFGNVEQTEVDQKENLMNTVDNDQIKDVRISVSSKNAFLVLSKLSTWAIIVLLYIVIGVITILVPELKVVSRIHKFNFLKYFRFSI